MMSENKVMRIKYVNQTTGEIVYDREARGIDYFNDEGYLFKIRSRCSRAFPDLSMHEMFSYSEVGRIHKLRNCLPFQSNILCKQTGNIWRPMTREEIIEFMDYNSKRGITFFNKLMDYAILAQVTIKCGTGEDRVQYYMNPLHYHSGKRIDLTLYMLFKEQLDPHIQTWAKAKFSELAAEQKKEDKERKD